ncbi:MAG TPA: acetyl-CoA carboxylase, carboxyltransferase subunit beta [Anaerohalosphaeraceae bacterium]|nr:acetyl-CoA carboxylase, carboxyltransferase subunit beta [Anaerohalosphaeraceae bacterium]
MKQNKKGSWEGYSLKKKLDVPEGLWRRCPGCEDMIFAKTVTENLEVCPECNYHFRVRAKTRIEQLCDEGSFEELLADYAPVDALDFHDLQDYKSRLESSQKKTGLNDAVVMGKAFIKGRPVMLAAMDPEFMMGSMGSVVGEKISVAAEMAAETQFPLVVVSCSGGARMQEGVLSLAQMAKTSAAIGRLNEAGGLFISILSDPTTGGVAASFAMLGDIIIAEPGALIGFAGPRTIWHTIKVELPEGFQKAEFLLEHGFVDMIVPRKELRSELARIIDYCGK